MPQKSQTPTEGTTIQKTDAVPEKKPSWQPWDKWLIGALTWLPFLLSNLALGLTFLTPAENIWAVQTYLWISGSILLVGLLATVGIGPSTESIDAFFPGLMVLILLVCFFTTYSVWQIWGIFSAVVVVLITIVVGFIAVFVIYAIGEILAEQLPIIGRGMVLVTLIILIPLVTAGGLTGNLVSNLINLTKIVVLIDLALIFAYWLVRGLREAKDNANHPVWITRTIYGGLVAAFGFIIWYSFLGGQAFL